MPPVQPNIEPSAATDGAPRVPLSTIYWLFFQIGSLSFGGGLTAWLYREVVETRKLLPASDFLSGLTLAQVLPGINMTNLSVYVGLRLRGRAGAMTALIGLVSVPFFAIIGFASIYAEIAAVPALQAFLDGVAVAAVGMLLSMGVKAVRATRMQKAQLVIVGLVVGLVGVLRWPMIPVILVLAPISIALVWPWQTPGETTGDTTGDTSGDA